MDILQILFFAGLAVFLAVRLYTVLGKPTGRTHEEHVREERERAAAAPAQDIDGSADAPAFSQAFTGPAGEGLVAIAGVDRSFDPDGFAEGAKQAYTMIVEAYAKGDRDTLEPLLSERVYKAYDASIADRDAKNQTLITEIERIKRNEIVEASLNDNRAKVRVAFSVELARELRDSDGKAVDGDLTVLQTVEEIWSFERDVTSTNPNWRLSAVKPA
jgi:predicted lipid-binding transport protein (Tim44 family)